MKVVQDEGLQQFFRLLAKRIVYIDRVLEALEDSIILSRSNQRIQTSKKENDQRN
jgi:hypothetical protein